MNFSNITAKQLMACSAIIEILQIFADSEIGGQYEINYEAVTNYIDSIKFASDYFECRTKEEVYERFTEDIYAGLPVWRWLILPEWTTNMVERSFKDECRAEYRELCKQYKCLTCKYYKVDQTELGVFYECTYEDKHTSKRLCERSLRREDRFELKKKCKNYEVKMK